MIPNISINVPLNTIITSSLFPNKISFSDLITQGVMEYLDAGEEENCLVGLTKSELTSSDFTPSSTQVERMVEKILSVRFG